MEAKHISENVDFETVFFKVWHPRCVLITVYKEWIKLSNTTILLLLLLLLLCSYMVEGS